MTAMGREKRGDAVFNSMGLRFLEITDNLDSLHVSLTILDHCHIVAAGVPS